ncbi:MAG: undecaprenyl-diphosphatase UppP [Anaerolinea sp.]|nr:undecaprenyl-diphosphatase UppP [Anaerolinea sp.]
MTLFQSIILGIVQGLTEFLPVSSSAHLVLIPYWLGWSFPEDQIFVFDVLVQMGTLLAVILYFWSDLMKIIRAAMIGLAHKTPFANADARLGWLVVLATIPAGFAGLLLKDAVEASFKSPIATASLLLVTSLLLILAEVFGKQRSALDKMGWLDALIIGLFQALSLFPGISRSGSTITGGLLRGLDRTTAARFSFLMSIPIMAAAGGVAFMDMLSIQNLTSFLPVMVAGFTGAAVVGFLSIKWLLNYLRSHSFLVFAAYCAVIFVITWIIKLIRG